MKHFYDKILMIMAVSLFTGNLGIKECSQVVTALYPSCETASQGPICSFKVLESNLIYTIGMKIRHGNKIWVDNGGNPSCLAKKEIF